MRTGSNPSDIKRFRMNTKLFILIPADSCLCYKRKHIYLFFAGAHVPAAVEKGCLQKAGKIVCENFYHGGSIQVGS